VGFQISALRRDRFDELFGLGDDALARLGAKRYVADRKPGFPCRVTLQDAEPGERVILVPFQHQPGTSPYRASGPIFVRESAIDATVAPDVVPEVLRTRLLSVRAYDTLDLMVDADVVEGREVEGVIERLLCDERVRYLHVHFARPGCYACRIDRG
jgi:hypothetical protein